MIIYYIACKLLITFFQRFFQNKIILFCVSDKYTFIRLYVHLLPSHFFSVTYILIVYFDIFRSFIFNICFRVCKSMTKKLSGKNFSCVRGPDIPSVYSDNIFFACNRLKVSARRDRFAIRFEISFPVGK